jgi:S1-C subfamily serine protease
MSISPAAADDDFQGNRQATKTIKVSEFSDLALLKAETAGSSPAIFEQGPPSKLGETLVVYGFPLAGTVLSEKGNLTVGNLTAMSGLRDDPNMIQISAPVQPGNSGGPVLNSHGHLTGIVVSKLNAIAVASATDDIPQNVNFAIKASVLENFLQANAIAYKTEPPSDKEQSITDLASLAQRAAVRIECFK